MSTVLITGAARGLGLDFTKQYAAKGWKVLACARKPDALKVIKGDIHHHALEVTDYAAVKALARKLSGESIDVLICNAGVGGDREQKGQELGAFDADEMRRVFEINTLAPLMMAEAFVDQVAKGERRVIACISSRMGSIAENTGGGAYIYRASKAALNALTRSLAHDLAGRGVIAVVFHPGWVRTDMGGRGAPLGAAESVAGVRAVIAGLRPSDSGRFFNYDGTAILW